MPIETVLDRALGIAVQRVTVELKGAEVIAAQRRLYSDPDHDPSTPVLWDARDAVVDNCRLCARVLFPAKRRRSPGGISAGYCPESANFPPTDAH